MRLMLAFTSLASVAGLPGPESSRRPLAVERTITNENQAPARSLGDGVLTFRLEARDAEWHPDGKSSPGIVVRAFDDVGKAATPSGTPTTSRIGACPPTARSVRSSI